MKEKIYTIPVNEAFDTDNECPFCYLYKVQQEKEIDFTLGGSLMEPDTRVMTNEMGFCRDHFEKLYNSKLNTLGLGLILESHITDLNKKINKSLDKKLDAAINIIEKMENSCFICKRLDYTIERYLDVTFYLYFSEKEFKEKFNNKKGFCLKHFKMLLLGSKKYLSAKQRNDMLPHLFAMQSENMARILEDVVWFNKKFDYRYQDEPWKNSKDAIPRSIAKLKGNSNLF